MKWILIHDGVQSFFSHRKIMEMVFFQNFDFMPLLLTEADASYIFPPSFITSKYFENNRYESDFI
jgi:hypothetical protein